MKCVECGEIESDELIYADEVDQKMRELQLCFDCLFWQEYMERVDSPETVRINGHHYVIGDEEETTIRGNCGCMYAIAFFDGRKVVTTNLWNQGPIPERFQDRLPDNAVFVTL